MRNSSLPRRVLAAASVVAALWACEGSEAPAPQPPAGETPAPVAAADPSAVSAQPGQPDVIVIPPFDPSLPTLEIAPPPVPQQEASLRKPSAAPKSRRAPRAAEEPSATASVEREYPSLDALLRAPYEQPAESKEIDLAPGEPITTPTTPKPPRALDRLGDSIRLERRGEAIGPAGPRQGTAWETDAGVRIPVDQSVSLEGGVRVDSREEPGAKPQPSRKTPRVGVEVRF